MNPDHSTLSVKEASKTFQQTTKRQTSFDVIGTLRVISDSVDAHAAQSHL